MAVKAKISDLIPDTSNFNTGTEFGESLIEKSFSKFGAGRSILLDKNNKIIAGNKSTQKFVEGGGENVMIVDADGDTLVAVRRNDIDLDTKRGREMALADNATAKANISWDEAKLTEWEMPTEEWGIHFDDGEEAGGEPKEPAVTLADRFLIPPFSVLDARQGYWQDRKRAWLALGIQSELGRGENLQGLSDSNDEYRYNKQAFFDKKTGGGSENGNAQRPESKTAKLSPGGSPRPAMKLVNGKTVRGDGYGKELR